jgi:hypothetical protein
VDPWPGTNAHRPRQALLAFERDDAGVPSLANGDGAAFAGGDDDLVLQGQSTDWDGAPYSRGVVANVSEKRGRARPRWRVKAAISATSARQVASPKVDFIVREFGGYAPACACNCLWIVMRGILLRKGRSALRTARCIRRRQRTCSCPGLLYTAQTRPGGNGARWAARVRM